MNNNKKLFKNCITFSKTEQKKKVIFILFVGLKTEEREQNGD